MKKLLCYISIFILLLFIILPPIFRIVFKEENVSTNEGDKISLLLCTKNSERVSSSYLNGKITSIRYNFPLVDSTESTIEEYSYSSIKEALETVPEISKQIIDDENSYFVDLTKNYTQNAILKNYQSDINTQKKFYTDEGFTCSIVE